MTNNMNTPTLTTNPTTREKQEFLNQYKDDYGYPNAPHDIHNLRDSHFKRLHDVVYLDHAGATLYSELQMEAVFKDLTSNVYGNPHSQSDHSMATLDIVNEARQQVLDYCNASPKEYKCIFTSGATATLKLVGEAFPWSSQSNFVYTVDNHNSVLGIREYALDQGATAFAIDVEEEAVNDSGTTPSSIKFSQHPIQRRPSKVNTQKEQRTGKAYSLFAFPSESNFSGVRYSENLLEIVKGNSDNGSEGSSFCEGRWLVLIDAAKGSGTMPLDLSKNSADFVAISFYKIFGYPTGLGALIVRDEAARLLKKTYFSGGTVDASIADIDYVKRRQGIEQLFEDGTISFLSIASLRHGFKILNSLTSSAVSRHTTSIAMYVRKRLSALRHGNGSTVCTIYPSYNSKIPCHKLGPTVTFNLKRPDGSWFGYREVETLASLSGIQLRTGCFCNPGACAKYLGLCHLDLLSNVEAGHVCWDDHDILNGRPTGAVRVSFGYMSTFEDAKKFTDFIISSFVSSSKQSVHLSPLIARPFPFSGLEKSIIFLKSIAIYPIKSCGGFNVQSWPLCSTGLEYDREWILRSLSGEVLTQKKVPEMCHITTFIDLTQGILFVESPRCNVKLQINLRTDSQNGLDQKEETGLHVHARRYEAVGYENEVDIWFSNAVGRPCTLLRRSSYSSDSSCCSQKSRNITGSGTCVRDEMDVRLNFVNEAQFLLISEPSLSDLNSRLCSPDAQKDTHEPQNPIQVESTRFRPNLVVSGGHPYEEDGWTHLKIENNYFTSLGGCNRCHMINLDDRAGPVAKSNEPLATLASYRRTKGKILFGILLRYETHGMAEEQDSWLQVGQPVEPNCEYFLRDMQHNFTNS